MPLDYNPCTRVLELRLLYQQMISGEQISEGRFGEDMMKFARGDANRLQAEIVRMEEECARQQGKSPSRRVKALRGKFKNRR